MCSEFQTDRLDALNYAWTIICNVSEGDWSKQRQEWQDAADRFRDQYHALLDSNPASGPPENPSYVGPPDSPDRNPAKKRDGRTSEEEMRDWNEHIKETWLADDSDPASRSSDE